MKSFVLILFTLLLAACAISPQKPPFPISDTPTVITPPTQVETEAFCAFMEGRQSLPEISDQFLAKLKRAGLPVEIARAEAYGENCIAEDGSLVRFAARETDYYVTFTMPDLLDEARLGEMLVKTMAIMGEFPIGQTPGPNPGYVGVTFKSDSQLFNLWFTRSQAEDLLSKGMKGAELYRALRGTP